MKNVTIDDIKANSAKFRSNLKHEVGFYDYSRIAKIPFRLESYIRTLNSRISDHIDSIILLYEAEHIIPAFGLIRSNFESLALLNRLSIAFRNSMDNQKLDESLDSDLATMALGLREKDYPVQAINILTQLKKMEKEWKGVMPIYESISEFVHPNYDGVIGSYSDFDHEQKKALLEPQYQSKSEIAIGALNFVNAQMTIAEFLSNYMIKNLKPFAAICELDLRKNS